jgi:CheY-like chemotaxis protein
MNGGGQTRVRALVVEDTRTAALHLEHILAEIPQVQFLTERFFELGQSLARLARGGLDLVFLDLNLHDSQGLDTLARVRAEAPAVPVIVLTGAADESLGLEAMRMGAQDFFLKGKLQSAAIGRAVGFAIERQGAINRELARAGRLSGLVAGSPDGMLLLDPGGRVVLVNPAAEAILGVAAGHIVGQSLGFDVAPGEAAVIESAGGEGALSAQIRSARVDWDGVPHVLVTLRAGP